MTCEVISASQLDFARTGFISELGIKFEFSVVWTTPVILHHPAILVFYSVFACTLRVKDNPEV